MSRGAEERRWLLNHRAFDSQIVADRHAGDSDLHPPERVVLERLGEMLPRWRVLDIEILRASDGASLTGWHTDATHEEPWLYYLCRPL